MLLSFGLNESTAGCCLYFRIEENMLVVHYVAASKTETINLFLDRRQQEFRMQTEPLGCLFSVLVNHIHDI